MSEVEHGELLADYLSVDGAADALGVSRRTLGNLYRRREGPPRTRVGGRVYFRRAALEEWLRKQEEVPARSKPRTMQQDSDQRQGETCGSNSCVSEAIRNPRI